MKKERAYTIRIGRQEPEGGCSARFPNVPRHDLKKVNLLLNLVKEALAAYDDYLAEYRKRSGKALVDEMVSRFETVIPLDSGNTRPPRMKIVIEA